METWRPRERQATLTRIETVTRDQNIKPKCIWETIKSAREYKGAEGMIWEVSKKGGKIRYRSGALCGALYTCQCRYDQRKSIVHNQVY